MNATRCEVTQLSSLRDIDFAFDSLPRLSQLTSIFNLVSGLDDVYSCKLFLLYILILASFKR